MASRAADRATGKAAGAEATATNNPLPPKKKAANAQKTSLPALGNKALMSRYIYIVYIVAHCKESLDVRSDEVITPS